MAKTLPRSHSQQAVRARAGSHSPEGFSLLQQLFTQLSVPAGLRVQGRHDAKEEASSVSRSLGIRRQRPCVGPTIFTRRICSSPHTAS